MCDISLDYAPPPLVNIPIDEMPRRSVDYAGALVSRKGPSKMTITKSSVRVAYIGAFGAAIVLAGLAGIDAQAKTESRVVAQPCTQTATGGSTQLQCGPGGVGGPPPYSGGCVNAFGNYQNCIVQLLPPDLRPNRR